MKIYFSGSISGGREYMDFYRDLISVLSSYGTVLTEHIGSENLGSSGENMDSRSIYQRDIEYLQNADIVIADVTVPSLGVGYELAWAEAHHIPVHCLFHRDSGKRLSAMVDGNSAFTVHRYSRSTDFSDICRDIFQKYPL